MNNKIAPSNDDENNDSVSKRLNPIFAAASKSSVPLSNQRACLANLSEKYVDNCKSPVPLNDSFRSDDDVSLNSNLQVENTSTEKRRHCNPKTSIPSNRIVGTITPGSVISASTTSLSSPFSRIVSPVVVGDRCCILFDTVRDFFGRSCSGWFPGNVTEVERIDPSSTSQLNNEVTYNIKVAFDDNAQDTVSWPSDALTFGKLHHITDNDGEYYYRSVYDKSGKETKTVFYCDLKPSTVFLGDLVMAFFQNGNVSGGNSGAWFRGRIAAVHKRNNKMFCDVAYDDGDYEEDVPLIAASNDKKSDHHVIHVLERGHSETYWLEGLTADLPSDRWRSEKSGVIQRITKIDKKVEILYKRGKLVNYETKPYDDVVEKLFESAREKGKGRKVSVWPFTEEELVSTPITGSVLSSAVKSCWSVETHKVHRTRMQRQISSGYSNQKSMIASSDKPPQFYTPKSNPKEHLIQESDGTSTSTAPDDGRKCVFHSKHSAKSHDDSDSSIVSNTTNKTESAHEGCLKSSNNESSVYSKVSSNMSVSRKRNSNLEITKSAAAVVNKKLKNVAEESDDDAYTDVYQNNLKQSRENTTESKILKRKVSQINVSLGTTLMQAVNSTDSQMGIDQLNFLTNVHRAVPDQYHCQRLIALMVKGPTSENGSLIPDSFRMQETLDYINSILSSESGPNSTTLANIACALGADSIGLFFKQMAAPYYMDDSDDRNISLSSLARVGQTIHAKICFASIYVKLLEHSLSDFLRTSNSDLLELWDKNCMILNSIRSFPGGTKGALVKSVELCVSFWFSFGHVIFYEDPFLDSFWKAMSTSSLDDSIQNVRAYAQSFVKMMGIVISYMARLYSRDANENVDALADLIRMVVLRELDHQKQKYSERSELTSDTRTIMTTGTNCQIDKNVKTNDEYHRKVQFQFLLQLRKRIIPKLKPKLAVRFKLVKEYNAVYG